MTLPQAKPSTAVTITRHTDAKFLNKVANDPSVYPWVRGPLEGELDLTPLVENVNNVLLMGEHGGMMFIGKQYGQYEIHTQILPAGRGVWCQEFTKQALRWMFTKTSAMELFSRVPKGNLGALALVRANHMVRELRIDRGWIYDGKSVPADVYSMQFQDWLRRSDSTKTGHWFVSRMESEYKNHGVTMDFGSLSEEYLNHIGAAVEMIFGGQKEKGVVFYNRWANMVGINPLKIVTASPLVIDCEGALIKFRSNDFWIMSCPS